MWNVVNIVIQRSGVKYGLCSTGRSRAPHVYPLLHIANISKKHIIANEQENKRKNILENVECFSLGKSEASNGTWAQAPHSTNFNFGFRQSSIWKQPTPCKTQCERLIHMPNPLNISKLMMEILIKNID